MPGRSAIFLPRRRFLQLTTAGPIALASGGCAFAGRSEETPPGLPLRGDIAPMHDPAVIVDDGIVHLFTTSHIGSDRGLLHWSTSRDLVEWEDNGAVFSQLPQWAPERVPGTRGLWAPDIAKVGGEYRIYYSVSTFGSNHSVIGMAATPTLNKDDPSFGWVDRGPVIASTQNDYYNAIDPNIVEDGDGGMWMSFGSFWSGIKLVRLDPETGKPAEDEPYLHAIARRSDPGAVEAPFIIRRGEWFYLFASFDFCCRGADSTYNTVVGRSRKVTGPYMDRAGTPMLSGAGTILLHADQDGTDRFAGPGHPAVFTFQGDHYIAHHAYDTEKEGLPTLRIRRLQWTEDGWPVAVS